MLPTRRVPFEQLAKSVFSLVPSSGATFMTRMASHTVGAAALFLGMSWTLMGADATSSADLSDFKTVDTATTTRVVRSNPLATVGQPGYLGVHVSAKEGKLIINEVAVD